MLTPSYFAPLNSYVEGRGDQKGIRDLRTVKKKLSTWGGKRPQGLHHYRPTFLQQKGTVNRKGGRLQKRQLRPSSAMKSEKKEIQPGGGRKKRREKKSEEGASHDHDHSGGGDLHSTLQTTTTD